MKNPTEKFQSTVIAAVTEASQNGVHPAIVYCVLGGLQSDVLTAIKQSNRMAKADAVAQTAETIVKSNNSKPAPPASPAQPPTLNPQPPQNVIQLPKTDPAD